MVEDSLTSKSITGGLATRFVGQRVVHCSKTASTMEVARKEAIKGTVEGTVVISDVQTAGRGRLGRIWQSPRGCIALSVVLYPDIELLPSLIMVASLAVVHAIADTTVLKSKIKWPNDIMIGGKKVGGVLVESEVRDSDIDYAIIGIGINVNLEASALGELALPATSLSDELGKRLSRLELVRKLLVEIERMYLSAQSSEAIYREWRDSLETLGRRVQARSGDRVYEGVAESVGKDGSLWLRHRDGSLTHILAGDVTLQG
jgi:BirA family biotin operon repressor/biotin-[acetyl-CoA-carboxylase] ligase